MTEPAQPPTGWRLIKEGEILPHTGPWKIWSFGTGPWKYWDLTQNKFDREHLGGRTP